MQENSTSKGGMKKEAHVSCVNRNVERKRTVQVILKRETAQVVSNVCNWIYTMFLHLAACLKMTK